ncbi:hypothetical protein PUMCH_000664 [Australozyma saopauloensis]|uniref:methionyl-tRNA formyltransferase n=1 Tax=Australozyma saopauloensis TaxID=291208 RepID=A0AAX4H5A9_9ASCO|nr:hypothetical protein PUMCH_000664 [[Candida] saopauloensis]
MIPKPLNLRVAFFGSDHFSLVSLKRLVLMHQQSPVISSIDVFTRSIKPTGRSLKTYVDVPIGDFAQKAGLPLFRVDSAQQITQFCDRKYDVAVAVSFGKLIPGSFLSSLRYGGLNVHPSLLPKFSGSSPIQYALMKDCKSTGVTVQTLHPTKFDHGDILRQSSAIEIGPHEPFSELRDRLAVVGADLLQSVLDSGDLVHPSVISSPETYSLAPKIPASLSEIDWTTMTSRQICRLADALGPLFSYKAVDIVKKKKSIVEPAKVILDEFLELESYQGELPLHNPGDFSLLEDKFVVKTVNSFVSIGKLKYQCCGYEDPKTFMVHLKLRAGPTSHSFQASPKMLALRTGKSGLN